MSSAEWVLLREYGSAMEANLDLGSLEMESVPTLVRGLEPGIFGPGFTGTTPHGVRVYVPSGLLDFARELVGDDVEIEP
jgi:hypothetical protein